MMIDKAALWQAATFVRLLVLLLVIAALSQPASAQLDVPGGWLSKLDPLLQQRLSVLNGRSKVIVRGIDGTSLDSILAIVQRGGGTLGRALPIIDAQAAEVPHAALPTLASSPLVQRLSLDRVVAGALEYTGPSVGAPTVRQSFGYDGSGVGVAVIDSGVTSWHDDLSDSTGTAQRVDQFVDFVNGRSNPYDDYGHGTHVAGIIAGNGFDSGGDRSGIAPGARLIVLKVLDGSGKGRISDVIAALGYAIANKDRLNIRVVNLSVATGVYESYRSDPLTLAAKRAVMAGIVVVAAAGNNGRDQQGREHFGGVTAPGNAPWVVTVGASSHIGTVDLADDTIAAFSSRGPAAVDYIAKPDVVAPGVSIGSLSDSSSALYTTRSRYRLNGSIPTSYLPYLSLSGTSMAAPVVSATVALMLQANRALSPNLVKAILQYTAHTEPDYHPLIQGAGVVNASGAVKLARLFGRTSGASPSSPEWGARLIWGNQLIKGGRLTAEANAWSTNVTWGAATTAAGQNIDWGVICTDLMCDDDDGPWDRWGATCANSTCTDVTWGDGSSENVVWGTTCGGANCATPWSVGAAGSGLAGTINGAAVVWGTSEGDAVVWGTSCRDPNCEPVSWNDQ
jgi:serine protease AprX